MPWARFSIITILKVKEIQIKTYGILTSDYSGQDKKMRNLDPVKREPLLENILNV